MRAWIFTHFGRKLYVVVRIAPAACGHHLSGACDWLTDAQGTTAAIEEDHVTRINPVRVFDGVFVQAPDMRPFPRVFEELAGDVP